MHKRLIHFYAVRGVGLIIGTRADVAMRVVPLRAS